MPLPAGGFLNHAPAAFAFTPFFLGLAATPLLGLRFRDGARGNTPGVPSQASCHLILSMFEVSAGLGKEVGAGCA